MVTRISEETAARVAIAWPDILAAIALGSTIKAACAPHGLTANELWAFRSASADRRREWNDARTASADSFLEQILETINNRLLDPAHARVRVDALKWAAAKRNPDHYSDRQNLHVTQSVDLRPALEAAAQRAARIRQWYDERRTLTLDPSAVRIVPPMGEGDTPQVLDLTGPPGVGVGGKNEAAAPERGGTAATSTEKSTKNNFQDLI